MFYSVNACSIVLYNVGVLILDAEEEGEGVRPVHMCPIQVHSLAMVQYLEKDLELFILP